ncbi:hypothetical protein [Streptomyces sp. NPDC006285]|uniref:hypothetical protein n=1 Tax=Streptomyces sp. NPDC006285 TaxID=3364742 RepID=UPI00367E5104
MSDEMKADLWRRWRAGDSISVISRQIGKPPGSVFTVLKHHGGIAPSPRKARAGSLTLGERKEISRRHGTPQERSTGTSPPQTPRHTPRNQPGTPLDIHRGINAAAESFWALLKEEIGTRIWPYRATARAEVFTFIETFYNRRRLRKHKIFDYLTPAETRQRHQHALAA